MFSRCFQGVFPYALSRYAPSKKRSRVGVCVPALLRFGGVGHQGLLLKTTASG